MNVLLLANHINAGGITSYGFLLGRSFRRAQPADGIGLLVASGGGELEGTFAAHGIPHFRVPMNTSSEMNPVLLPAYFSLERILREHRIGLIHDQTRVGQMLGFFLSRKFKIPRVSTCHGFLKRRFVRGMIPLWGDRVIAVSGAVARHLKEDWRIPKERIRVIPHGFDRSFWDSVEQNSAAGDAERDRMFSESGLRVGALGRLSPVKGFHVLIEAVSLLREDALNVHCVIVGSGPDEKRLRLLCQRLGIEGRVRFVPNVADRRSFLEEVDIFCAPSLEEGFGFSILEAMASRTCVIASQVGGIPSLVDDGRTGLLVPSRDARSLAEAIQRLGRDPRLRRTLGEAARARVLKNFNIDRMLQDTRAVYEEFLR